VILLAVIEGTIVSPSQYSIWGTKIRVCMSLGQFLFKFVGIITPG